MVSGNFLIGEGLPVFVLNKFVIPYLVKNHCSVPDMLRVPFFHKYSVLVSVVGVGKLDELVNSSLVNSSEIISVEAKKQRERGSSVSFGSYSATTDSHVEEGVNVRKGLYETIGIYLEDVSASQFFPHIARDIFLRNSREKTNQIGEKVKEILEKRLCEF